MTRPVRQLKGFERVTLAPGESREVSFTVDAATLSFWRADMSYGPEAGEFKLFIGGDAATQNEAAFTYEN